MDALVVINKHKNKILNIGLIILALIITNNIYKKQTKEVDSLKAQINTEQKKNAESISIGESLPEIDLYKKLLNKVDTNLALNTISNLAKDSDIKILSINPEGEKKSQDYVKVPFNLAIVTPDYNSLGQFISKIENYKDVFTVEKVRINPVSQKKELNVDLSISSISFAN